MAGTNNPTTNPNTLTKEAPVAIITTTTNIPTNNNSNITITTNITPTPARLRRWVNLGFTTREIASHLNITLTEARRLLRGL